MTGATPMTGLNSQLRAPRVEVDQLVNVTMFGGPAFILNLGIGGMAIQAGEVLQPGCIFSLNFSLPNTDCNVQSLGKVVWSDPSGRAGLKFVASPRLDRMRLHSWVHSSKRRN